MTLCPGCGSSNEAGRKFCRECGTRLALPCPACGTPNDPGDKFCGECGTPLGGTPRPAAPAPRPAAEDGTERRLVSVLFVDLVGFTSYSENRDAEDVRAMLSRYFESASDAVNRHGGTVEKFIGDAVMAVWGTPVAHEDDAERAVRSALEIVDRVEALGAELGVPLKARAGVLTGEAVAALNATDQGFVTGDLVNTASRLQSAAEPGTVLVGERTQRATGQSIAYEPVEPLRVKGKEEPVPAFRALRLMGEMKGNGRGSAPEPPFVGRDEQLRLTKELLSATGREGRPRLLHISGVAGIGKSRLVWELLKYLDGLTESTYWHSGRCPSYGDGVTFWALAEMVRSRARIADTDDAATSRRLLADCLEEFVPDLDERRWIEPRLGHLLGLDPAPSGDRDELFGAWRRFFERIAEHGTVALVIEDLHWADPGLMDFLESMLEASRTSPILVLTLARPELMDRRPSWGHGVRSTSILHLDRLADSEIREMVEGYVDGLPDDGLRRLVDRAEGVPMYAVETVRMLADRGVLEQRGSAYVAVGELGGELDIPETLHALVAARLDGLPDAERALVQDCSVAGQSFTVRTVCAVSGREADEVEPLLRQLVRKEVLEQDVDPRSPERGQYAFVQSVIREVAYSTLSKSARRTKHLACAQHLASLPDEDLAGVVASHFLEAYRADPSADDAEMVAVSAREWLARAGARALSLGSPDQALRYAMDALELADTAAERGPLHHRIVDAGTLLNSNDLVWEHHRLALDAYRASGTPEDESRVLTVVGYLRWDDDRRAAYRAELEDVLSRLPADAVLPRVAMITAIAGQHVEVGDWEPADTLTSEALVLAQSVDDEEALYRASGMRGTVLRSIGRGWEARLMFDGRRDLAQRLGDPVKLAAVLDNLTLSIIEDDMRQAFDLGRESARISDSIGDRASTDVALMNCLELGIDLGEWEYADQLVEELRGIDYVGDLGRAGLEFSICMLQAHRGDPASAVQRLKDIHDEVGGWSHSSMTTWYLRALAYCQLLAGDDPAAVESVDRALAIDAIGVNAFAIMWSGVQAAAGLRDSAKLRDLVTVTMPIRGRHARQIRQVAWSAAAALEGAPDADVQMAEALDSISADDGMELPHAFAVLVAVRALGRGAPSDHVAAARADLIGLGAVNLLRLIDAALES